MGKWPSLDKMKMIDGPLDDHDYERRLKKLQNRLLDLQVEHLRAGSRVIIGIDGWDAAGKGGLIERIVYGLEPKSLHVWRIGAPTPEEQGRHYLWRFWQRLPLHSAAIHGGAIGRGSARSVWPIRKASGGNRRRRRQSRAIHRPHVHGRST